MFNNYNLTSNDDFLGTNSEIKTVAESFDYNSFYRAVVVSNYDPENLGRIKINIPSLHSGLNSTNQYPWAYPGCFVGFGNQVGQFILPPVGSIVFVAFEYSDEHRPIYFGGIPSKYAEGKSQSYGYKVMEGMAKQVTDDDIPLEYTGSQAIVYKSPEGSIIYFDDAFYDKKVVIKDSVGQTIEMETYDGSDGELYKAVRIINDESNYLFLEPNKLTLCLDGTIKEYDKNHMPGSGDQSGDTAKTVLWD